MGQNFKWSASDNDEDQPTVTNEDIKKIEDEVLDGLHEALRDMEKQLGGVERLIRLGVGVDDVEEALKLALKVQATGQVITTVSNGLPLRIQRLVKRLKQG